MSDGGAQVIVAAGEGVLKLARFSVGRVLLWFIAAWLTLSAITARSERSLYFFLAVAIALVALAGHFLAERRRRAERAALRSALGLLAVVLFSLVGGWWLAFRRKPSGPTTPPTEAEIDELLR